MGSPSFVLPIGAVALVCFGLGACEILQPKIDKTKAEGLVKTILTNEKIEPTSVTCPADEPIKKGHVFECTALAGEVEIHFKVEQLDDEGTVVATPRDHTLVVSSVESEIKSDLQAAGHQVKSIDCHGDVWVAVKGATVTCDLTDEADKAYLWTATFTDGEGGHSHKVTPK
jgi:hypothetical protein